MQTAKTDEQGVRIVCYSPEKRITLQQAYQSKSPVKIVGTKRSRTYRSDTDIPEYTIPKAAKIVPTKLDFNINQALGNRLYTVEECLKKNVYETVDVKIKVMMKSESKQAVVYQGQTMYRTLHCCRQH